MMRKDWIDEAKPRGRIDTDEEREIPEVTAARADPSTEQMHDIQSGTPEDGSAAGRQAEPGESAAMPNETSHIPDDDGNPDEDDLDALLAESAGFDIPPSSAPNKLATQDEDPFADDMEAMAEMEDMW
jgi:replication fork protection complex subunit Csm3/Swi3